MAAVLIRQYDVFRNSGGRKGAYPYVLVLQSDAASDTRSVVVAPLTREAAIRQSRLTPVFAIERERWTLVTPELAPVPRSSLIERVTTLASEHYRITGALDVLFTGV